MIRRIISFVCLIGICWWLLRLGGYNFQSFSSEVHLKDPAKVLAPLKEYVPELPEVTSTSYEQRQTMILTMPPEEDDSTISTTVLSNDFIDENGNFVTMTEATKETAKETTEKAKTTTKTTEKSTTKTTEETTTKDTRLTIDTKATSKIDLQWQSKFIFTIDGKSAELSTSKTASFIKWLNDTYSKDSKISYKVIQDSGLEGEDEIKKLVSSIHIVSELPTLDSYDRTTFEKPIKSYTLDGKKVNRNDYAWKTSPYFNEKDFTYTCPYTGKVIKDLDDKKDDKDFGTLDYDHLVPLASAYARGAKDWTPEQQNAYAYDQSVGVDVLYSANRSKSDKGPAEWLPDVNRGSYCYSWLVICQKYNLTMTEEEIKICNDEINKAIKNGETVEFMCGNYNE